jgi:hypothetical protein
VGRFTAVTFAVQSVLTLLSYGIGRATYPLAVEAVESKDPSALHHQLTMNFTSMLRILLPAGLGLSLAAPNFVSPIVGPAFFDVVIALAPWLAAVAVIGGIRAQYFDYWFRLGRKTGYLMFILTITAVVNVGLNVTLILRYGEFGCAMGAFLRSCPIFGARACAGPAGIPHAASARRRAVSWSSPRCSWRRPCWRLLRYLAASDFTVKIAVGDAVYMASGAAGFIGSLWRVSSG